MINYTKIDKKIYSIHTSILTPFSTVYITIPYLMLSVKGA